MQKSYRIYLQGIGWFLLSLISSSANDLIAKFTTMSLPSMEVTFLRFFFSTIILIPFILFSGINLVKTSHIFIQVLRGILLFCGMSSWIYGLNFVPVSTATIVSFSIPIFTLILAVFLLDEKIIWERWIATIIGFIGVIITLLPDSGKFNYEVLIFILAAFLFSLLDVINKKFVIKETTISMLFYSALFTSLLALPFAISNWVMPNILEIILLFLSGCSGNLILFFLLRSFSLIDATAVAPYRYFELIVSALAAYIFFSEIPNKNSMFGLLILVPTTFFIAVAESRKLQLKKNQKHNINK